MTRGGGRSGGILLGALALGVLAVGPLAAPASAGPAGAGKSAQAGKPETRVVGSEAGLRRAVFRANRTRGPAVIRLAASIAFDPDRDRWPGAIGGDLDVRDDLTIIGNGFRINANQVDRIFDVHGDARLVVKNTRLWGGAARRGTSGGAIRTAGTLRLVNSVIGRSFVSGTGASGGAIMNDGGRLTVVASTLRGNDATRAGGAIEALGGTTRVLGSTLHGNATGPEPGNGGALHLTGAGRVAVRGSSVTGNFAMSEGGGLWNSADGTLRVANTTLTGNTAAGDAADQGGGGLFNDGGTLTVRASTLTGNDATGAAGSGGGILNNLGTLRVLGTTLAGNSAPRAGGGIEANVGDTTLTDTTLEGNSTGAAPGNGGGLHLTGAGTVEVSDSVVTDNTAAAEGGGLWNSAAGTFEVSGTTLTGNAAAGAAADQGGGALFNDGGSLTVSDSTIEGNQATGAAGSGGGILNNLGTLAVSGSAVDDNDAPRAGGGIESNVGTVTLTDVDMSGNSTGANPGNGGGLHITGAGMVTWTGGTVTGNDAANEGGGLWNSATGTLIATMLEVMGNTAPTGPDVFNDGGVFTLNGVPVPPG